MKIIDLLNKIANGEEVPKKIKYNGIIYNLVYKNTIQGSYDYESSSNYLIGTLTEQKYLSDIVNVEVEIIEEDKTPQETIKQISKMIASGKIPKDIYDEYLSNCPIGFMNENELVDFLLEREAIDENSLENIIDESLFEDKDIEKITIFEHNNSIQFKNVAWTGRNLDKAFAYKINELIDEVNILKNKEK